jgi:hypothetical protein
MILLGKLAIGTVGVVVTAGSMLCSEGFVSVRVHEKRPDGTHLSLYVPAMAINGALRFVPKEHLQEASEQIWPWVPTIEAAVREMGNSPDITFVEVKSPDQHVVVATHHGSIVVDVDDEENSVHVSTPLRAIDDAVEQIAAAGPKN